MNWRLFLSYIIPVPMRSTYEVIDSEVKSSRSDGTSVHHNTETHTEHARWWQWRDMIFAHRVEVLT